MVIAGALAFVGLVMPYVVVPMRRAAGLPTYQWDSDTATSPVRPPSWAPALRQVLHLRARQGRVVSCTRRLQPFSVSCVSPAGCSLSPFPFHPLPPLPLGAVYFRVERARPQAQL